MEPKNWGNYGWGFIHSIALGFPENPTYMTKNEYRIFFESIGTVLPCLDCAKHYKNYLLNKPPILISKDSLFKWTVDIHNSVNQRLNKETITYQQAYDIWLNKPVEKKKTTFNYLYFVLIIILVFILIFLLLKVGKFFT